MSIYICVDLSEHHQTHKVKTHDDKTNYFKTLMCSSIKKKKKQKVVRLLQLTD